MLYAAWKEIARSRGGELALVDVAAGREWTFAQLEAEGERRSAEEAVIYPCGAGGEFIFDVLRAWRANRVVCPLDQGQAAPALPPLPRGWLHLKTSSGTSTGTPQMIAFTEAQLAADARNIVETMGMRPDWPNLGVISLAHSYGFSNLVLPLLLHGVPLILLPSRLPEAVRQACQKYSSLTLPAVPALWRVWHEAEGICPAVKLAISAGAPLPVALETAIFKRTGVKVHNFYGASECGGICYDASDAPRTSSEDVGVALRGVALQTDAEGCLGVISQAAGETYWPKSSVALGGGKFQTGDRAELRDGRVFLRGRRGDVINLAGRKVAPELIEQAILRHPGVRDCVVFSVPEPDGARGETIAACVAARGELTEESLRRFVGDSLPDWQAPRHWWFVAEIEEAERGKISRARWRERFLASKL
ncbi:MAG TPA: class I adenylate-forming enzyme family protein [Verrucomicrobiae bacterium]|jgi:acyl-CoA synthetase (AMP-forming)/AMP-acid ligase II|nr:class I adenylate-forming enzyme family protein [Verrucomicrobiae bacterium]